MGAGVPQTSGFWSLEMWQEVGGLDEDLHYCMDEDLFMRFYASGARPVTVPEYLAVMVIQPESKTSRHASQFAQDFSRIVVRNLWRVPRDQCSKWRAGKLSMAENYGLRTWQYLACGDPCSAWGFAKSGVRLSGRMLAWGMLRGAVAGIRRRFARASSV